MLDHLPLHTNTWQYECAQCETKFKNYYQFDRHKKDVHGMKAARERGKMGRGGDKVVVDEKEKVVVDREGRKKVVVDREGREKVVLVKQGREKVGGIKSSEGC